MVNHCYNRTTIDMNDIKVNLTEIYLNHPGAFEEWLVSEGNENLIKKVTEIKSRQKESNKSEEKGEADESENEKDIGDDGRTRRKKVRRNNSVTSELFQVWVSSPKNTKSQNGRKKTQMENAENSSADQVVHSKITTGRRVTLMSRSGFVPEETNKGSGCTIKARSERRKDIQSMDESDFFMELIRDVATELDIDVLCHKILINVCLLTYADRGSLFLARGPPEKRYLVAKLFDVTVDTEFEEAIQKVKHEDLKIPFGVGIVGNVAQSKEIINIKDAYNDPRFNSEVDMRTGYKTNLILSMPICNYEGDVIGVAQIINKTNGSQEFTKRDVEVFQRYLTFGGIGIQNAQLFELSVQEYKRNQILLHLARSIFEEQSNLDCLVTKIMREARDLLKCERCAVYLLDLESCSEESRMASAETSDYDSSSESLPQQFGTRQEPFVLLERMIDETRTMILGILRGDLSDEVKTEIRNKGVDLSGSYDGVSKVVKKCLRKAKNREEGKDLVRKCIEKVVRERQTEVPEEEGGPQTPQTCIQAAMLDASQSAAPLMMEAQEHAALFREMVQKNHLEHIIQQPNKKTQERQPLSRRQSNNINVDDIFQTGETISKIRFSTIFELRADETDAIILKPKSGEMRKSKLLQIAKYVAANGQILNISDVTTWMNQDVREDDNFLTKSILCMPISNGQKTLIGVAQLINKTNQQPFTDSDVSIFEAFAIFCGLGIHNTQMYENACKLMAKQKVALECLSYHASASVEDTERLHNDVIPSAETYNLLSFKFIDFKLPDEDTCRATIRMFMECNLINHFQIPYNVLCRWVLSVKKNYRPVKYHNWRHALNVAQTMFAMLKTGKMERFMTDLEILGLLVACLCHDLDHRGTNNAFQTKTESPLAILYTTSTMEHHHFDQCVMILNSEGNNIFQALSPDDYRQVMKVVENAILSTDLAMYFKKKNRFRELVDDGEFDWQSEEKKEVLCGMMMTACDVSAISKPWEVQHKMAKLVADEFFDQGDLEKLQLNQQPVAMMDRERKDELPQMQVGFIDVICLPLYKVMSDTFPWIRPLYEGCLENRNHWQDLAEKVEMGLTWIDHDTIDKPVEEFAANADEQPEDIEFTVTTLNCSHSLERQSTTESENGLMGLELQRKVSTVGIALGRFASLRKVKGKSTQNRQSRSLYSKTKGSNQNSPKKAESLMPEDECQGGKSKPHKVTPENSSKQQKRKKLCILF